MANEDPQYLSWVRRQHCAVCYRTQCEAHHNNFGKGMSQRSHDHTAIPLCLMHHRDWHNVSGPFKGWQKEQRKVWSKACEEAHRAMYLEKMVEPTEVDPVGEIF